MEHDKLKWPWNLFFLSEHVFIEWNDIHKKWFKSGLSVQICFGAMYIGDTLHTQTCTKFSRYCTTNRQTQIKSWHKRSKNHTAESGDIISLFLISASLLAFEIIVRISHRCDIHTGSWDTESTLLWWSWRQSELFLESSLWCEWTATRLSTYAGSWHLQCSRPYIQRQAGYVIFL